MITERRPTRAETSDVANTVLDGTDAVMVSGETAVGDHPVRVVETMTRIIDDVEASEEYAESSEHRVPPASGARTDAIARFARYLARDVSAEAVVTVTESGYTAHRVAKYRPEVSIVAVTPDARVRNRLALLWGVTPRYQPSPEGGAARLIKESATATTDAGITESGDTVVVIAGMMIDLEGASTTNTLKLHLAAEVLASGRAIHSGRAAGTLCVPLDGNLGDCPDDAVAVLPAGFEGERSGNFSAVAAIVAAEAEMIGYPAMVGRELDVPVVGGITESLPDGAMVTVDGDRGVVYAAEVAKRR